MTPGYSSLTVVAVANRTYASLSELPTAVDDTASLVELLERESGYTTVLVADEVREVITDRLETVLAPRQLVGGALIVLWAGHGMVAADRTLQLMARKSPAADAEAMTPARLSRLAAETGAAQILLILDTCYSGNGVADATNTVGAVLDGRSDVSNSWFGVVAASRPAQKSLAGVLQAELKRLLTDGPVNTDHRLRWDPMRPQITGMELIEALLADWQEVKHRPWRNGGLGGGASGYLVRNPLGRPSAQSLVVEHLLQAARSTSTDENYFTGREEQLSQIVGWLDGRAPGLCIVTGPAGSGKSGLLGRIVSLSVPSERSRLTLPEAELDPGESSVSAHLHLRGLRWVTAVDGLLAQFDEVEPGGGVYDLLALAARHRRSGIPLVVVLDGLDEAGESDARDIAIQVIEPLAREALVVVGTREVAAGAADQPGLLAMLGQSALTLDLGADLALTMRDVHRYVVSRLAGKSATMDAEAVAAEVVRVAQLSDTELEGPFLFARLVSSQLRDQPIDTSVDGWQDQVASSVFQALEDDLRQTVLTVAGRPHPTAARELLLALACAHGRGMPPMDVWPVAATALSPTGTTYTSDDVYQLLATLGRHVVTDNEVDQQVYRIAHQRLVDHLRPVTGSGMARQLAPSLAVPLAAALHGLYVQLLDESMEPDAHTYLWRYLWRHCADAGSDGLALLRALVERDPIDFSEDLAMALGLCGLRAWWSNDPAGATLHYAEAVELRRTLDSPVELAGALFDLALGQSGTGDSQAADDSAAEASQIARSVADDPRGRVVLTRALLSHASTRLARGFSEAALRLASEAIELVEPALVEDPDLAVLLGGCCTLGASAALNCGEFARADELSERAVTVLTDHFGGDDEDLVVLSALLTRATLEFAAAYGKAGGHSVADLNAADRMVAAYRRMGSTQSVFDILAANGLRLLAQTTYVRRSREIAEQGGDGRVQTDDLVELLTEGIGMVSHLAGQSTEAALALALLFNIRGVLGAGDAARADFDVAEQTLAGLAPTNPALANVLGELMYADVARARGAGPVTEADLDRLREAVDLLANPGFFTLEQTYPAALRLLYSLDIETKNPEAPLVLEMLVEQYRLLADQGVEVRADLALLLSDLAGHYGSGRAVDAVEAATEGLDLLDGVDPEAQAYGPIRGVLQVNLSPALAALGRWAEAREAASAAIELLHDTSNNTIADGVGVAHTNRALVLVNDGQPELALDDARQAITLLERPTSTASPHLMAMAHLALGRALAATGDTVAGGASITTGLTQLRAQFDGSPEATAILASGLNLAGDEAWAMVFAEFDGQPDIQAKLSVLRLRPETEVELTVTDLLQRIQGFADDPVWLHIAHDIARVRRYRQPALFDAAWQRLAGDPPPWLLVDPALSPLVVAWVNADDAWSSRQVMLDNPRLLEPEVDLLIEELAAVLADPDLGVDEPDEEDPGPVEPPVELELRRTAADIGVEAAYAPLIALELVEAWLDAEDMRQFLADNEDELLSAPVSDFLGEQDQGDPAIAFASALLVLARRSEHAVLDSLLDYPASGLALLPDALQSGDADRLVALCILILQGHESSLSVDQRAEVVRTLAAGRAMQGDVEGGIAVLDSAEALGTDDRRTEALERAREAHPEAREALDALLDHVNSQPAAPPPDDDAPG